MYKTTIQDKNDYECYKQILKITKDYLGAKADQFVTRLMRVHLKKEHTKLRCADIPMLAIRIRSGLLVLTSDVDIADEAYRRINQVGDSQILTKPY